MGRIGIGIGIGRGAGAKLWKLAAPAFALMNTTKTQAGTADQIGWTQGLPWFRDKNGNDVLPLQSNTGSATNGFTFRNSGGSWADGSLAEAVLIHGACAYDATNNLIHALWYSSNLGDPNGNTGYVYRRYVIQYSGNNITDIVSDNGVTVGGASARTNLVIDAQGAGFSGEQPSLLLVPNGAFGTLVAMWPMQSATGAELRIAMCALGASANRGQTAGNWANPLGGATATTTIGGVAPYIAYGKAYVSVAASTVIPYSSLHLKASGANVGDLCVAYSIGTSIGTIAYRWVRLRANGTTDWSTGLSSPVAVTNVQRAGTDTGYSLKYQLLTAIAEDAAGNCYVGLATWLSNVGGDTWGYAQITNSAEVVALVDVYSASGAHSYAPTGDIAYDATRALLVVSYIKTTTQFAFVRAFAGLVQKIAEQAVFSAAPVDIPYFLTGAPSVGQTLPMVLRDTTGVPYHGYAGTVAWQ